MGEGDIYFWTESDGWRFNTDTMILGPFKSFDAAVKRWRLIVMAA